MLYKDMYLFITHCVLLTVNFKRLNKITWVDSETSWTIRREKRKGCELEVWTLSLVHTGHKMAPLNGTILWRHIMASVSWPLD